MSSGRLRGNISSLLLVQILGYALPLVTLPYLVRVLGAANFGRVAFAQALVQYFVATTDYGFALSATQRASTARHRPAELTKLLASVVAAKSVIALAGLLLLALLILVVPGFDQNSLLYLVSYLSVLGSILYPVWFFQGLERMKAIAWITTISRLLSMAGLPLFVTTSQDYVAAAALLSAANVIAGVLSWGFLAKLIEWKNPLLLWADVVQAYKDGWPVFASTLSTTLYTNATTIVLGCVATPQEVGYFSAADRACRATLSMLAPVSQAIYPHINHLAQHSREKTLLFLGKATRILGAISLLTSIALLLFAPQIVAILFGSAFGPAVPILRCLSFVPFMVALSNIFGIQTMLTFGMQKEFRDTLVICGIGGIGLIAALATTNGGIGAAIAVLLVETTVTAMMYRQLSKHGIHLFKYARITQ